jgi:alcohol oxidase
MDQTVPKTVDIIIAGGTVLLVLPRPSLYHTNTSLGGSSGCVLAARLASSHPTLSILLVEGGPSNKNNPQIIYPALFLSNLLPGSKTARSYVSNRSENVAGRSIPVAAGGCLGGGGSVNFSM